MSGTTTGRLLHADSVSAATSSNERVRRAGSASSPTAARAADALPYGTPVGAPGNFAYVYTLAEVPAPRSCWERIRDMFGG